jgi:hypothetical protein
MNNDTPDRPPGAPREGWGSSQELSEVKRRIDKTVGELSRIRHSLNRVRKSIMRELHRPSTAADKSGKEQVSSDLRPLHEEEAAHVVMIGELEKVLSDLWSHRRQLENKPLAIRAPSVAEAEEQRLRWLLLDIKDKQLEAARQWQASETAADRAAQEARFDELRHQYNSVYEKLNQVRDARQDEE